MYTNINNKKYQIENQNTYLKKLLGLMFKKEPIKKIYKFNNCNSIHTFFMKQNIDVIMLDKNNKIVLLKENVKKNKIIIKRKAKTTLECPLNTVKYLKLNQKIEVDN